MESQMWRHSGDAIRMGHGGYFFRGSSQEGEDMLAVFRAARETFPERTGEWNLWNNMVRRFKANSKEDWYGLLAKARRITSS